MTWPAWLWIGSRLKLSLWLGNRVLTGTGLLYFWRRWKSKKHAWVWLLLLNLASLSALALVFFWLYQRAKH